MTRAIDITDERFGRLTAIRPTAQRVYREIVWACVCDCGNKVNVRLGNLRAGHTKSCGCLNKFPEGQAAAKAVLVKYRVEAQKRNLVWALTDEEAFTLFGGDCFYCGVLPANVHRPVGGNGSFTYSGIDRVDNDSYYINENCVSCCAVCNRAKQTLSVKEFHLWVQRIYNNFGQRGD